MALVALVVLVVLSDVLEARPASAGGLSRREWEEVLDEVERTCTLDFFIGGGV